MKICRICQQDCSTKPRVRDPQGNYYCKACLEAHQAKQKAQAPPPPEPDEPEGFDLAGYDIAEPESAGDGACPTCGASMPPGATLCVSCGYSAEGGAGLHTKVAVERAPARAARSVRSVQMGPRAWFVVMAGLGGVLFALSWYSEAALAVYLLYLVVIALISTVYVIAAPFMDGDTGWGIFAVISSTVLGCLWIVNLWYVFVISERGGLKAVVGTELLLLLGWIVLVMSGPGAEWMEVPR